MSPSLKHAFGLSVLALALAGCGGGGGGGGETSSASAQTSQSTTASTPGAVTPVEPTNPTTPVDPTTPTTPIDPTTPTDPSTPTKSQVATLPAGTSTQLSAADCANVQGLPPGATPVAGDDTTEAGKVLMALDTHAYQVFSRAPVQFAWWLRSSETTVSLLGLGNALHETNHQIDGLLNGNCGSTGAFRYFSDGQIVQTDLRYGDTSNRSIIADTYPAALKTSRAMRYDTYVTGTAGNSGNDFSSLLEEFNAYLGGAYLELKVRSDVEYAYLYKSTTIYDQNLGGTVDFMLFMQHYLLSARLGHATTYAAIQAQPATRLFMQQLWSRAETILASSYPYTSTATGAGGTVVPGDVLAQIYSAPMLAELDALGITHRAAADWSTTYLK